MNQTNHYQTADMALAAALLCEGYPLFDLDRDDPRRVCFVFTSSEALSGTVNGYWNDQLQVSPKQYFDQIKHLKTRIYAG